MNYNNEEWTMIGLANDMGHDKIEFAERIVIGRELFNQSCPKDASAQYKVAHGQKKHIYCPHPELGLNPSDGIKLIIKIDPKVRTIRKNPT